MEMGNDLVSIIMLSHGDATYVEETVKSGSDVGTIMDASLFLVW